MIFFTFTIVLSSFLDCAIQLSFSYFSISQFRLCLELRSSLAFHIFLFTFTVSLWFRFASCLCLGLHTTLSFHIFFTFTILSSLRLRLLYCIPVFFHHYFYPCFKYAPLKMFPLKTFSLTYILGEVIRLVPPTQHPGFLRTFKSHSDSSMSCKGSFRVTQNLSSGGSVKFCLSLPHILFQNFTSPIKCPIWPLIYQVSHISTIIELYCLCI